MMRRPFPLVALLALLYAAPSISDADSPADVLRRSNEGIHRFTMENGIIGLVKEDRSAPVAAIQLWFGTGSIHEDEYLGAGLSHYVEHMIFKGTPTRGAGDISRELDAAGGRVNAYTTFDRTVFHVVLPSENWEVGLDVLSDAVMNASFPEDEWENEQTVILQEMAMNRDNPRRELSRLLWNSAFRTHPYQHPVIGYKEVFLETTRDDLIAFFHRHYTPDNMIFAVAGDVNARDVEKKARAAFSEFDRRARPPVVVPAEPPQIAPRFARKTGAYEVSRAAWGWHTVPLHHPDAAALDVLAAVIGRGESARLTLEIRDRKQLVHNISAWSFTPGEPGLFGINATFDPEHEEAVMDAVEREIERWRDVPFSEAEIDKARRQVMIDTLGDLQTMRGQVHSVASGEFYAGDPRFSERYLKRLDEVTPDSLHDVLNRYVRKENRTLALLTPERPEAEVAEETTEPLIDEPVRLTLTNGIPLIVREDRRLPLVHVAVTFLGGLLSEDEKTQGITQFTSDLLTRGTTTRSARDIAETLESLGARLSPFSGLNSFGVQGMSLTEDLDSLLDIIADILLDSTFPEEEITRQRTRQLAEIRAQREQPFTLADERVRDVLYPGHPYRWTPLGNEDSVSRLARADLKAYLERHLRTGNMAISIFGPLTPDEARAQAERVFAEIPEGDKVVYEREIGDRDLPTRITQRKPHHQTIFLMAFPGVTLLDEHLDTLDVLRTAMSGLSSELAREIRDKRGLVYFVGALQRAGLDPGRFVLYAGTFEEAVEELEALMDQEIGRILADGLSEEELARAQEQIVGDYYATLQDSAALAQVSALNELYGLGYDHAFRKEERIRAITNKDIREAASTVFEDEHRVISIVFPPAQEPGETLE